jgi:hypothetical protein
MSADQAIAGVAQLAHCVSDARAASYMQFDGSAPSRRAVKRAGVVRRDVFIVDRR